MGAGDQGSLGLDVHELSAEALLLQLEATTPVLQLVNLGNDGLLGLLPALLGLGVAFAALALRLAPEAGFE